MKLVQYIGALLIAIVGIVFAIEIGIGQLLPDVYRGYLIEQGDGRAKWTVGPYGLSTPTGKFNGPVDIEKDEDTIRIVALGASGTEGWLSANAVFSMYGLEWKSKNVSSYSRAIEFSMNAIADQNSRKVEVINLGVAAYNAADTIRMLKDSMRLDPDFLIIQIGGNETWTTDRTNWSNYVDEDIPYFSSQLGYELLSDAQAGWATLKVSSEDTRAFNPLALFNSGRDPIVVEPPGRDAGMEHRLDTYKGELERLASFVRSKGIPAFFLIPPQNIADFQPFGSMAKTGTDEQQLKQMNELLVSALAEPGSGAREKYLEILQIDDGVAEANFQLGKIYLSENKVDEARRHFWIANDRDLVLKRLPSAFHDVSRAFLEANDFPHLDTMAFFESKSSSGIVGYNWLFDDVHPSREAQFELGQAIVRTILSSDALAPQGFSGDINQLPDFQGYNAYTGFDEKSVGEMAYIQGMHNYYSFGRFRKRLMWDPNPGVFLDPVLEQLEIANTYAPGDASLFLTVVLNFYLGREDELDRRIAQMGCDASPERASQAHQSVVKMFFSLIGRRPKMLPELKATLNAKGCVR